MNGVIWIYLAGCLIVSSIVTGIVIYTRCKDRKRFDESLVRLWDNKYDDRWDE